MIGNADWQSGIQKAKLKTLGQGKIDIRTRKGSILKVELISMVRINSNLH